MHGMVKYIAALIVIAVAVGVGACGGSSTTTVVQPPSTTTTTTTSTQAAPAPVDVNQKIADYVAKHNPGAVQGFCKAAQTLGVGGVIRIALQSHVFVHATTKLGGDPRTVVEDILANCGTTT
jgi:hypothetical protein